MAIDPRISMAGQPINIGQRYAQTLQNLQNQDILGVNRDRAPLLQEQLQLQTDLLNAEQTPRLQAANLAASPLMVKRNLQSQLVQEIAPLFASNNPQAIAEKYAQAAQYLQQNGGDMADVQQLQQDAQEVLTPEGFSQLQKETESALSLSGNLAQKSVSQREFENNVALVKADPKLLTTEGKAAAIALGLEAKVALTAEERKALDTKLGDAVTKQLVKEAEAIDGAKQTVKLKFEPQIKRAVILAEKEAAARGEALTDKAQMTAALPGLMDAVASLRELSTIATSTIGGKVFDFAVKETGFGTTEGANARAKFIAIVSNQVLPLLKPTFGGSFTVDEGNELKATLGDPDASPEQKMAQLDAFIAQKIRNIESAERQISAGDTTQQGQVFNFDAQGNLIQ